jgi:circadian clock protein KaiC
MRRRENAMTCDLEAIERHETGIRGFDVISEGGLPKGNATLLAGSSGSGKSVMAVQFLVAGIAKDQEPGVFVTFEEPPAAIRSNVKTLGWDIKRWEQEGKWVFVDVSPEPGERQRIVGEYDLAGLLIRIEEAVRGIGAKRIALDSAWALLGRYPDVLVLRSELFLIMSVLADLGVTSIVTAERTDEYGSVARYGVEEFVADNVIILRNVLEDEKRRRTIEILKFRGASHKKGEFPFSIVPGEGVVVIPLAGMELKQKSSEIRISSGSRELDEMCGGGFFRDSIVLVSGATGTGKTLMSSEFMAGGALNGEKCLLFAFEESQDQLRRNASGWGIDFMKMEAEGKLKIVCEYPEVASLEDHLIKIQKVMEEFNPDRVAIDSLSALERVSTIKSFREFVIGLTSFIKSKETAGLFTSTTPSLMGGVSITETHISTITDSIILLRYVETYGEMRRAITVLKMRGSKHAKSIHELTIDETGMHIGKPFGNVTGIISGNPVYGDQNEADRMRQLFSEEETRTIP